METIILKNVFTASVPVRFSVEKFQSREESTTIMKSRLFHYVVSMTDLEKKNLQNRLD